MHKLNTHTLGATFCLLCPSRAFRKQFQVGPSAISLLCIGI